MKIFGKELMFNNKKVYHEGNKPTASDINFTDGQTFQQKLDNGSLKGAKGDTGAKGADGLTTSVTVGSTKYTHSSGNITIPAYPTSLKNPTALTVQFNGTTNKTYDGSSAQTLNITPAAIGAATSSHTHSNYITNDRIMDGAQAKTYLWSSEYIANTYLDYTSTAASAKTIKDYHDNQDIQISYMASDLSTASWFAAWDGRKLLTISGNNLRSSINAAEYFRIKPEGDNRSVATTPNTYSNEFSFKGLKQGSTIGLTTNTYSYLFGLRGWSENSGGKSHELAFNDSGIWTRRGATTSWESWQKLITSHDANFDASVRFNDVFIKKASGARSCCVNLYTNPDRLEFFWSGTAGGEDWTWGNKSYISADGQIYAAKQLSAAGHRISPYSTNGVSIIRPDGQEFSGLEIKELWIGPYGGATKRLSMSASAPSGPGVGDVWIQNN